MSQICVVSPKCTSKSAKWLASSLGADYINPYKKDKYDFTEYKSVINYGFSGLFKAKSVINHPNSIQRVVDKTFTFKCLDGLCRIPKWTVDPDVASMWVLDGHIVVCRAQKSANNSKGIVFATTQEELVPSKFYTLYIDHKAEYRVNVFKGKVISVLEKTNNGDGQFKFKLIRKPKYTFKNFIQAIESQIRLDLYGMDILLGYDGKLTLLEVNSGPALFGQTSVQMLSAIKKEISNG